MKPILSQSAVKLAGWFALAYLGYWVALAFDRILVEGVAYPLLGIRVTEWFVSAFRIRITQALPDHFPARLAVFFALPVLVELPFLILLARWGARLRAAFLRIAFHFAGLWIALFLSTQGATLAYRGSLRMGQFNVPLSVLGPNHMLKRFALTAAVALIVLGFGALCARRLLAELRSSLLPREGWTGLALVVLIAPVLVILMAAFNFFSAIHFWGLRVVFYLLVPAAGCLILALLGLSWKPAAASPLARLSGRSGAVAVCASAALYAGLQQAPRIAPWLIERHLQSFSSTHYQMLYDSKAYRTETIRAFAAEREHILAEEAARLQEPPDAGARSAETITLRVVLYPDLRSLRAATGSDRLYSVDGTTIRAVLGGYIERVDPAADAAALLNATWGRAGTPRMGEWVARWVAGEWRGRATDHWAAQMEHEVGHYTLAQLAASSSDAFLSPLVRQPLGAAWVGSVFDRWGLAAVRRLYGAKTRGLDVKALAAQLGVTPRQLEQDWRQWTAATASRTAADPPPQRLLDANFFFRGISFSHEGWAGRGGGYISPEAASQLRHLSALGANAIALVPYGFAGGPREETISYTDTDETDEQLTHALHVAHSLSMKVMLKPQLWVTRGEFTGAIRFNDLGVRAAWMRNYREFILHYARLGELEQFDLLSISTELEGLTPYPDDWRRLIAEVRRVYHGPITYAANWGHEFESITFWDALDYASVNNYYPLRSAPLGGAASLGSARPKDSAPPHAEDLLPGAERLADKLEALSRKWHKPVLFTEVGYPSVHGGASEPWIEDANRGVSIEEQAAAYEATFRAFSGRPWFLGMFWWKWPSSGRGGGPRDASYTPLGKPAEEVLQAWFTRLAGASKPAATPSQ